MHGDTTAAARNVQVISKQPQLRSGFAMIVVRMATGVKSHFHIRATEWVMLFPATALGLALFFQSTMFDSGPSFNVIKGWADELTWSVFVLFCAALRMGALAVNGTFQGFGISPHMRLTASFAGAIFWSQFGLGFVVAAVYGQATWLAPLFIATFCMMEVLNITRSWTDVVSRRR